MVMLGGATGSLTRYLVGTAIMNRMGGRVPLGTALVRNGGWWLGIINAAGQRSAGYSVLLGAVMADKR
jgi:fluoride ion exporter CrcB/FEX